MEFSTPANLDGYYLAQDYMGSDGTYSCHLKAAYMTTVVNSAYILYPDDAPLLLNMTFIQDQGIPFNISIIDVVTTLSFSTSGTWYSADYTNLDANGYILITFDPQGTRTVSSIEELFQLNFKVFLE
jgi:hypothetical protein